MAWYRCGGNATHKTVSYRVNSISASSTVAVIRVIQFIDEIQTDTQDIPYQDAGSHIRFHDLDIIYSNSKWRLTSWSDYIKYNGNEYGVGDLISEWAYNVWVDYMMLLT